VPISLPVNPRPIEEYYETLTESLGGALGGETGNLDYYYEGEFGPELNQNTSDFYYYAY
jgi:hypothetical protein